MNKVSSSVFIVFAAAALVTGCASLDSPPKPDQPETAPSAEADPVPESLTGVASGRTASGQLRSPDGRTTGRVEVELRDVGEGNFGQEYAANIEILDLQTPYPTVGVYGSYWVRQDDRCADAGFHSGDFELDGSSRVTAEMGATWTWEDWATDPQDLNVDAQKGDTTLLHEVALTRNQHMQESDGVLEDLRGCQNLVVAEAVLTWDPVP